MERGKMPAACMISELSLMGTALRHEVYLSQLLNNFSKTPSL